MKHTFISLSFFILLVIIALSTSSPEIHSRQELKQRNIAQDLQKVITNGCLDLPPKNKFKTSTYFRGYWYLNRFYVLNFPRKDEIKKLCARKDYRFSLLGRATEDLSISFDELDIFRREYNHLSSRMYSVRFGNLAGKFSLCDLPKDRTLSQRSEEPNRNCHIETTVLDTDYDNYSIEYSCGRMGFIDSASIINIYTRRPYIVDEKVETSLKKFGLNIDDFKLSWDSGYSYCVLT